MALLLNEIVNGERGVVAVEDAGRLQIASHMTLPAGRAVLPRADERSGEPRSYRLEPFVPLMSFSSARLASRPRIPFRFPSGSLEVRVTRPGGGVDVLGPAPFRQSSSCDPLTSTGRRMSPSSARTADYFALTTLDEEFDYVFPTDGDYRIELEMSIEDVWGGLYESAGTYEVTIGRILDIDPGVIPGTPFQVGDAFVPSVVVTPPVPAEIEMRVRLLPRSKPEDAVEWIVRGRANRFGSFVSDESIRLPAHGEFRVDVSARYLDEDGTLWAVEMSWGNVVETPGTAIGTAIVTHGRRGFDDDARTIDRIQEAWFVGENEPLSGHIMYPFHFGDVMWMLDPPDRVGLADVPKISVQDPTGEIIRRIREHPGTHEPPDLEERIAAGEVPLTSRRSSGFFGEPSAIDRWGYFYAFAERPSVRAREFISEDASNGGYWRFDDTYQLQLGNGSNGDLPNEFKFHYGGAVFIEPADDYFFYGAYASLFVLLPDDDPDGSRVFPPFQGAAGGPSGGPIMTLKGRETDIFFHPTGVRAGTLLEVGDVAS